MSREITLWQNGKGTVSAPNALPEQGLGGWTLNVLHEYDPEGKVLQRGDGSRVSAEDIGDIITTKAGGGYIDVYGDSYYDGSHHDSFSAVEAYLMHLRGIALDQGGSLYFTELGTMMVRKVDKNGIITKVAGTDQAGFGGDGGPAEEATLSWVEMMDIGPDGSIYVADPGNNRIRKISPDGVMTTVAGIGPEKLPNRWITGGFGGDEGPAMEAQLGWPSAVAVGPDGSLYISDSGNYRIRRIGPDGIITTVAGTGEYGYSGDGKPAVEAQLNWPEGITVGPDGSVYFSDAANDVVRRIGPDGIITTVAGTGYAGFSGDGGQATEASLYYPTGIALGPDGAIYFADGGNNSIRRIGTDGIITTIAGISGWWTYGFSGDGGAATGAQLDYPVGVAVGADGTIYFADDFNDRIRWVGSPMPGGDDGEITIPSEDGSELYVFDSRGKHLRTLDTLTGAHVYEFSYDGAGHVTEIKDVDGLITTVERDGEGNPTALVAPNGERTELTLDGEGYLASVANPAGETVGLSYVEGGLLSSFTDPKGNTARFSYAEGGRLAKDEDPSDGYAELSRSDGEQSFSVDRKTALGRKKVHEVEDLPTGDSRRTFTDPSGFTGEMTKGTNGTRKTTAPDGTTMGMTEGPDPRFGEQGMLAPLTTKTTVRTPEGLISTTAMEREAELSDPNDPLSVESVTDTVTANGRTYTSTYDAATKETTTRSPEGREGAATIDEKGRVNLEEPGGLAPTSYLYDERGRLTEAKSGTGSEARTIAYEYDALDRLSKVTDPLSRETSYAYDDAGRVTEQTLPDGSVVSYSYDSNGNLVSVAPPEGSAHEFAYTARDERSSYTAPALSSDPAAELTTTYEHDPDGAYSFVTRPGGDTISFEYDAGGRPIRSYQSHHPSRYKNYSYDQETGNLKSVESGDLTLHYVYDGSLPKTEVFEGEVTGRVFYHYDEDFRLKEVGANDGEPNATYDYDKDGLMKRAGSLSITRDPSHGLITETGLGKSADTRTYDAFGQPEDYAATFDQSDSKYLTLRTNRIGIPPLERTC